MCVYRGLFLLGQGSDIRDSGDQWPGQWTSSRLMNVLALPWRKENIEENNEENTLPGQYLTQVARPLPRHCKMEKNSDTTWYFSSKQTFNL